MLEIIKSLSPKQKLIAVLVITLISSTSSILTMYFKTDDCKGISDQYTVLIKNHVDLMKINNDLIGKNNILISQINRFNSDFKIVNSLISQIDSVSNITKTDVKVNESEEYDFSNHYNTMVYSDSVGFENNEMMFSPANVKIMKVETSKTVTKTPIVIKNYIDSINKITSKYKKQ